jgi:hypothetical protein
MIIFGFGRKTRKDHGRAFASECVRCHNQAFYRFLTIRVWFTLFFIPVIPYKVVHLFACEVCGHALAVPKGKSIEARKLCEAAARLDAGEMSEDEYRQAMEAVTTSR